MLGAGLDVHPAELRARMAADLQNESDKILLDAMMEHFSEPGGGWTRADLRREFLRRRGKDTTFYRSFDRLVLMGVIGRVGTSGERYRFVPLADREATPLDIVDVVTDE
jgi:hypothetical protein